MVELDERQSRAVRAHPLFAAAVHVQRARICLTAHRPDFRGPNPDQLIEQMVGWSAAYEIEALVKQAAPAIRERRVRECQACGGEGPRSTHRRLPDGCQECYVSKEDLWEIVSKRNRELLARYSFELQCWGVVAAMVGDEAMAQEKVLQGRDVGWGIQKPAMKRRRS